MAITTPASSPARARRNRRVVIAAALAGIALAALAPHNQRALFVTDGSPADPSAYFVAPESSLSTSGLPGRSVSNGPIQSRPIRPFALALEQPEIIAPPVGQPFEFAQGPFSPAPGAIGGILSVPFLRTDYPPNFPLAGVPTLDIPPSAIVTPPGNGGGTTPGNSVTPPPMIGPSPVPEPATWATMIGGLLASGAALRRAPQRKRAAA